MSKPQSTSSLAGLSAFLDEVGRSPAVAALCRDAAERCLANAKAEAAKHVDTGAYIDSLHVEELPREGRRAFGVVADDPKGMIVEAKLGILARSIKAKR